MQMTAAVLSGFALAVAAPWLNRIGRGAAGWIFAMLPLGLTLYFASYIGPIAAGRVFTFSYAWVPSLGVSLSFYLDGLSLLFSLLITGIGTLVVIYAGGYLAGHAQVGRFYAYILMFMASMLGVVLSDNLIALFVFWELTSLTSYLLIGFNHGQEDSRAAALQALLITAAGGLALLAGLLLLGQASGSLELSNLFDRAFALDAHRLYLPVLLLVLIGAFTKSAQFPFHFWLPNAMAAPTPVSAYLHSATMVKAGIYLLARLSPILNGTLYWQYILTVVGAVTMLIGAYLAWQNKDLKRVLAYSTISSLGTLTLLLGLGTPLGVKAAMVFLLAHSLYKGALFLVAGAVDHETGTRNVDRLGGLRRVMPITTVAGVMAAMSMAGLFPMFGFIGKELIYEATLEAPLAIWLITFTAIAANIFTVAAAAVVAIRPFFGPTVDTPKKPHEAPISMWSGPLLLAGLGLIFGIIPAYAAQNLISPAVTAILRETTRVNLALWHGPNFVLALSLFTLLGGIAVYIWRRELHQALLPLNTVARWGPETGYGLTLDGLMALAKGQTRLLQSGYLRYYLMLVISTTVSLVGYTLFSRAELDTKSDWPDVRFYELAVVTLILAATVMVVQSRSRLAAVAALGVIGYGVALLYIIFGAPDLAMTQFAVETLLVILFVLVLYRLPRFSIFTSTPARIRDALIALTAGGLMTTLVLAATAPPLQSRLMPYFAEQSVPLARGRNIVNVILVDFRELDTLGEITVLAVAAYGVYALMKLRLEKKEKE